jgi:hypothetical protein
MRRADRTGPAGADACASAGRMPSCPSGEKPFAFEGLEERCSFLPGDFRGELCRSQGLGKYMSSRADAAMRRAAD